MSDVLVFHDGGYRYIKAVFQYSSGVAAEPGFVIERVRLGRPLPLKEGFAAVENYFSAIKRPMTAFCACELRSPVPFTEAGFTEFNREYVKTLERWGIYRNQQNPVARTNVCPVREPPKESLLYAFSYTVPAGAITRRSFIIAGGGELKDGSGSIDERIVSRGDTSPTGLRNKMRHVVAEMTRRLVVLGFSWQDALATQTYTVFDIGALAAEEIIRHGAAPHGLTWHFCRPPVVNIDYEMDVRGAVCERTL